MDNSKESGLDFGADAKNMLKPNFAKALELGADVSVDDAVATEHDDILKTVDM